MWKAVLAAVVLAVGASACSGGSSPKPGPSASTTTPPSTIPTTSSTTAAAGPPTTASPVGLVVTGQGSTFTPPAAPTVKPYSATCASLLDPGFTGPCVVISSPAGTIAALVETQQYSSTGAVPSARQERDLVYHHVASGWSLAERRVLTINPQSGSGEASILWQSDINRDGDPKAVFVTPAANSQFGNELDVVETTGQVIIFRQLHGGFATVAPSGGLETFVPDPSEGYDQALISYTGGAWRIASVSHVSQTQAQSESNEPFTDPAGHQAFYQSHA